MLNRCNTFHKRCAIESVQVTCQESNGWTTKDAPIVCAGSHTTKETRDYCIQTRRGLVLYIYILYIGYSARYKKHARRSWLRCQNCLHARVVSPSKIDLSVREFVHEKEASFEGNSTINYYHANIRCRSGSRTVLAPRPDYNNTTTGLSGWRMGRCRCQIWLGYNSASVARRWNEGTREWSRKKNRWVDGAAVRLRCTRVLGLKNRDTTRRNVER